MKKIFYFLTFLFILSCNNNEDPVTTPENELVGTWNLISLNGETESQITYLGLTETATSVITSKDISSVITLTENPNEFSTDGQLTLVIETTSILGTNSEEFKSDAIDNLDSGQWNTNEGNIIFTPSNGENLTVQIASVNSNTLILNQNINTEISQDGYDSITTGSATLVFEK